MARLVGPGLIGAAGPTSATFTTPFPHRPGDKARDRDGNEYVFVYFSAIVYPGTLVLINSEYVATPLLGTARIAGRVGVVMAGDYTTNNHPLSASGGWVQIYGLNQAVQTGATSTALVSDNTVAYVCVPQTSVGTPTGTFTVITGIAATSAVPSTTDPAQIYGMWLVDVTEMSNLGTLAGYVSNFATSGVSGVASDPIDPSMVGFIAGGTSAGTVSDAAGLNTSFDNTSAFIGNTYAVYLNYPYVTGVADNSIGPAGS